MSPQLIFCIVLAAFILLVAYFDVRFNMLRDASTANKRPYSFARVQLTWWTVIILSAFISILISKGQAPVFWQSTLILLGISSATTAAGSVIDNSSDPSNPTRSQNQPSDNFFLDILSDNNGISIPRFQTVVFNLVFGIWFICTVFYYLQNPPANISMIIPDISSNNLILLGLSSGTYAALKTGENKS
jgi:hypothetical protein